MCFMVEAISYSANYSLILKIVYFLNKSYKMLLRSFVLIQADL